MYVQLGADPVSAGCSHPYMIQGDMAYSRAFLERINLKSSLRSSYVPSASAKSQMDAWIAAGLDPFVPVPVYVAQSKISCGGIAPGSFEKGMQNKAALEKLLQENNDLRMSDPILNAVAREIFGRNQFTDADVQSLNAAISSARARAASSSTIPAPALTVKAAEPPLNVATAALVKPVTISTPTVAVQAAYISESSRPMAYDRPPVAAAPVAALSPLSPVTDKPKLSSGKLLLLGASVALIFLLGKSGKK